MEPQRREVRDPADRVRHLSADAESRHDLSELEAEMAEMGQRRRCAENALRGAKGLEI